MTLSLVTFSPSIILGIVGDCAAGMTTIAMCIAMIQHRLSYVRKRQLEAVVPDDLVGQYIGHTAPKTKEVHKLVMGVLFIESPTTFTAKKMNGSRAGNPRDPLADDGEPARANLSENFRHPYRVPRGDSCTTPTKKNTQVENVLL